MLTVEIPRLLGARDKALAHVADAVADDEHGGYGEDVCVNMRECISLGPSAMQALVTDLLVTRQVHRILLRGCTDETAHRFVECARTHGLASLVYQMGADEWIRQLEDLSVRCICNGGPCMCGSRIRDDYLEMIRTGGA